MGLHVFFGCYFNLFRLMAKCGVLENLLRKVSVGGWGVTHRQQAVVGSGSATPGVPSGSVDACCRCCLTACPLSHVPQEHTHTFCNNDGDVRELDFRFNVGGQKIGAPFHGECVGMLLPRVCACWLDWLVPQLAAASAATACCLLCLARTD
jgi:zeta-carotene desaturase